MQIGAVGHKLAQTSHRSGVWSRLCSSVVSLQSRGLGSFLNFLDFVLFLLLYWNYINNEGILPS